VPSLRKMLRLIYFSSFLSPSRLPTEPTKGALQERCGELHEA